MRTLVVPDIHCRWKKADQIINKYNDVDEVVCLGDYFDDFEDTPKLNRATAEWLKENILYHPSRIALVGNHEFNYIYNKQIYKCSGYSSSKKWDINKVLTTHDWHQMKPYHRTQGWYLTHAGISSPLVVHPINGWNSMTFAEKVRQQFAHMVATKIEEPFFVAGITRGGIAHCGGITWCHYPDEFYPIEGVKQIFGHTPADEPRQYKDTDNWCIDTHNKHIAIITDGELEIIET